MKIILILCVLNFTLFHAPTQNYNIRKSPSCRLELRYHHTFPCSVCIYSW